jgi:hypothetical protein
MERKLSICARCLLRLGDAEMKRSFVIILVVLLGSACSPTNGTNLGAQPLEAGKDPACVKKCEAKQRECMAGAKNASQGVVYERCYDGYEICVKACRPIKK